MVKFKEKNYAATPPPIPTQPAAGLGGKFKAGFNKIGGLGGAVGLAGTALGGVQMIQQHKAMKEQKEQAAQASEDMNAQTEAINRRTETIRRSLHSEVQLKTKKFAWPLIASLAMGGAQMAQSAKQGKEAEKMNKQQLKAQAKATEAQNRQNQLLQEIKENEELSAQEKQQKATQLLQKTESLPCCSILQRNYATIPGRWDKIRANVSVGARDLYKAGKASGMNQSIKSTLKGAAIATAVGYGANKLIQRNMKKNKMDVDEEGNLTYRNSSQKPSTKSYSIMTGLKKVGKKAGNFGMKALGSALDWGLPVLGEHGRYKQYKAERDQLKAQVESTKPREKEQHKEQMLSPRMPRQKQFGVGNFFKSISGKMGTGWKNFKSHPGQSLSGAAIKYGSSGGPIGMAMGGGFGTKNVQGFANGLSKSNVKALNKAGTWMQNHKTGANLVMAAPLIYTGAKLSGKVTKLMRKGMEKIDPKAYRYQKAKEKQAEGQQQIQAQQ